MQIEGKIIQVWPVQRGVGKSGKEWVKQEFVLETKGQYPKKVMIGLLGKEKVEKYEVWEGLECKVEIELESREYNGRWYTEVRAWKMEWDKNQRRVESKVESKKSEADEFMEGVASDDLPF